MSLSRTQYTFMRTLWMGILRGADEGCWTPDERRVRDLLGWDRPTVRRTARELRRMGLIRILGKGNGSAEAYKITSMPKDWI